MSAVSVYVSYQRTSWATVAVLAGADPGVNAPTALGAALGPRAPRGPEDRLRTGNPFVAKPVQTAMVGEDTGGLTTYMITCSDRKDDFCLCSRKVQITLQLVLHDQRKHFADKVETDDPSNDVI